LIDVQKPHTGGVADTAALPEGKDVKGHRLWIAVLKLISAIALPLRRVTAMPRSTPARMAAWVVDLKSRE